MISPRSHRSFVAPCLPSAAFSITHAQVRALNPESAPFRYARNFQIQHRLAESLVVRQPGKSVLASSCGAVGEQCRTVPEQPNHWKLSPKADEPCSLSRCKSVARSGANGRDWAEKLYFRTPRNHISRAAQAYSVIALSSLITAVC